MITDAGIEPEIVLYMKNPLSVEELGETIEKLGISPEALVRKKESIYKEEFKNKTLTDEEKDSDFVEVNIVENV
mgnify:CR=1 FL=1